jgi:hypothetical protein
MTMVSLGESEDLFIFYLEQHSASSFLLRPSPSEEHLVQIQGHFDVKLRVVQSQVDPGLESRVDTSDTVGS